MLGPIGVPTIGVKRRYDEATAGNRGETIPAVITVAEDRTWVMRLKTPTTTSLIRAIVGSGSARPGHIDGGVLSVDQLRQIAVRKLPDLNTTDIDIAMRTIAGTARSMGIRVE